jgi:hypothetical protein
MAGCICGAVGLVTKTQRMIVKNEGQTLIKTRLKNFRAAFHRPFGDLV